MVCVAMIRCEFSFFFVAMHLNEFFNCFADSKHFLVGVNGIILSACNTLITCCFLADVEKAILVKTRLSGGVFGGFIYNEIRQ